MTYLLVFIVAVLVFLIGALMWEWFVKSPATDRYRSYRAMSAESSMRNRVWDAAVSRARNRIQGPS